jgi:hypothetical protein
MIGILTPYLVEGLEVWQFRYVSHNKKCRICHVAIDSEKSWQQI